VTMIVRTFGLVVAVGLLSACARGVDVAVPSPAPTGPGAYACAALHGRLPDEVDAQKVVASHPNSDLTSAWGNPAITIRCGVLPPHVDPSAQIVSVDGVDWYPEKFSNGYRFTTVHRALFVEVNVPSDYAPEADALADISPSVAATIPLAG
jgi:hypothetical protein